MPSSTLDNYQAFLQNKIALAPETGIAIAADEIHPLLKPHQRAIVQWAVQGGRRGIFASFGLGKCVGAGTMIPTEKGLLPIEALMPSGSTPGNFSELSTIVQTPEGATEASAFYNSGYQPTLKLITRMGFELSGTYHHPVLTLSITGKKTWKTLDALNPGDYVAIQRHDPVFGNRTAIPPFQHSRNGRSAFHLTSKREALAIGTRYRSTLSAMPEILATIGDVSYATVRNWVNAPSLGEPGNIFYPEFPEELDEETSYILGLLTGDGGLTTAARTNFTSADTSIVQAFRQWLERIGLLLHETSEAIGFTASSIVLKGWLESIGLLSTLAHEKKVPWLILQTTQPNIRAYLQGLFDTDGSALARDGAVEYCSSSECLARHVHLLLLQFGVIGRLRFKSNNRRGAWIIQIFGAEAEKFYDHIGFRLERKQERRAFLKKPFNPNIDIIPHLPAYNVPRGYGSLFSNYKNAGESPSYRKLRQLALVCHELEDLTKPELFWDEVVTVQPNGIVECYDLSVHSGHSFVSNGIVSHNTSMQLETLRLILAQTGGSGLIVCPLGVRQEFFHDARMLDTPVQFIRTTGEIGNDGLYLTNYESVREGKLDPRGFAAVSLDEAAILRGFGGTKTFRTFMGMFEGTSTYRFVATATPDPNEYIELLAYAAFLGIMDVGEAKTRWFKRDSQKADKLTLHKHKEEEFWLWVSSWALFVQKPSDLGYSDEGYDLPPLTVNWHEIPTDHSKAMPERNGQGRMFKDVVMGLSEAASEKRDSLLPRLAKAQEIIAESPNDHYILWHNLEDERHAIRKSLPEARVVYGKQDLDERERDIIGFANGEFPIIAAKPVMLSAGVNFQRYCHRAIFMGIDFKFNDLLQGVHRIQRFLQTEPVEIDFIYTEAERSIKKILEDKWVRYTKQAEKMSGLIREYGLANAALAHDMQRSIGVEREEVSGDNFMLVKNDTVLETWSMPDNSAGLIVTSIPFSFQYEYSPSYNDFGHTDSNDHFWAQMAFLTPQLFRVLQPGRIMCIHVKDRIVPGGINGLGFQTLHPFHAEAIFHYQQHGFAFLGMKTLVTDVVRENNQTYRLGWSEQCKDGSRMGCGVPEYILLFRKPPTDLSNGYGDIPIIKDKPDTEMPDGTIIPYDYDAGKIVPGTGYSRARWQIDAHGFERSSGNRFLTAEDVVGLKHDEIYKKWRGESETTIYDHERHVALGELMEREKRLPSTFMLMPPHSWHPDVWTDITRMRTLNMEQERRGQEGHLCPLQLDVVNRLITQLSMPGEKVYDPFSGLATVPYCAVKLKRYGIGVELNKQYFEDGVKYCKEADLQRDVPTLFDLEEYMREQA